MSLPHKVKSPRWRSWLQGGGLFVVVSLGLHWAVLRMPLPESPTADVPVVVNPTVESTETISVVRVPSSAPESTPEPVPQPTSVAAAPQTVPQPSSVPQASPAALATPPPVQAPVPEPKVPETSVPEPEAQADPPSEATPDTPNAPDTSVPETTPPPEQLAYQYNGQVKSVDTSGRGFNDWHTAQDWFETYPFPGKELTPPLQVAYSLTACLSPAPAPGMLAVILNPDGSLAEDPILVSSTGYDELDQQALEAAMAYDFPTAESAAMQMTKVHPLQVEVSYSPDSCTP